MHARLPVLPPQHQRLRYPSKSKLNIHNHLRPLPLPLLFPSLSPTHLHAAQLYGKTVPNTVQNFVALVTGKNDAGVSYQGTEAYRVLDGLNIQVSAAVGASALAFGGDRESKPGNGSWLRVTGLGCGCGVGSS